MYQGIIPDHILQNLASTHPKHEVRQMAEYSLAVSDWHRKRRRSLKAVTPAGTQPLSISVYTAGNAQIEPGSLVRKDSPTPDTDPAVNTAYANAQTILNFYQSCMDRYSIDDRGMAFISTIHYGSGYDNAFWDGGEMVYGDGDGHVFKPFVTVPDIPGHEASHGVTQYTSGLNYQGQPGALNESFSDCMGSCIKQFIKGQTAQTADWLIGEGIFFPSINGRALRDMRNPGTAYDDPNIGKDPQPANMKDFVGTADDDGGVHINSGIPNRAFALACIAVGGPSWEKVGKVWYKTQFHVSPSCDFLTWAKTTVSVAQQLFPGAGVDKAIADAWNQVGLQVSAVSTPPPTVPPTKPPIPQPPSGGTGIPALKFRQLLAYIQNLLIRFGPAALPYIEQLLKSLPLNSVQAKIVENLIQALLAMIGGNTQGVTSDEFLDHQSIPVMLDYLCAK